MTHFCSEYVFDRWLALTQCTFNFKADSTNLALFSCNTDSWWTLWNENDQLMQENWRYHSLFFHIILLLCANHHKATWAVTARLKKKKQKLGNSYFNSRAESVVFILFAQVLETSAAKKKAWHFSLDDIMLLNVFNFIFLVLWKHLHRMQLSQNTNIS